MTALRTIYIVAFESPGESGGFEWRYSADDARAVEAEVAQWPSVLDGSCALARFAAQVEWGLNADEITDDLDARLYSVGEFDGILWPSGYPDLSLEI